MNNKGTGQPRNPCSLISGFVISTLEIIISKLAICIFLIFLVVYEAEEAGLSYLLANTKDRVSHKAHKLGNFHDNFIFKKSA